MRAWPWLAVAMAVAVVLAVQLAPPVPLIEGVFWQPDLDTARPHSSWEQIGARVLIVQWLVDNGRAWYRSREYPPAAALPDWHRIARAPWASRIVVGLVARSPETAARADLRELVRGSRRIVTELPVRPFAYYATVEDDPTWPRQRAYRAYLNALPRPLWLSVYTPAGEEPAAFGRWLRRWIPPGVTVLIQDGVGVGHNTPRQARALADAAIHALGAKRVALVVEAFRRAGRGFRAAWPWELWSQFTAYRGLRLYVFDGPHYLSGWRLWALKAWALVTKQHNPRILR